MKLKSKIILIFSLFILLLFAFNFNNIVFGASNITFSSSYDSEEYTVPNFDSSGTHYDYNNGYIIYKKGETIKMSIYASPEGFCYHLGFPNVIISCTSLYNFTLDSNTNEWVYIDTTVHSGTNFQLCQWNELLYFSKDLYSDKDASSIDLVGRGSFFQTAVVLVKEVQELPAVIAETLKVIIPVCLIVLGTIVVIYLVKRVIYLSH